MRDAAVSGTKPESGAARAAAHPVWVRGQPIVVAMPLTLDWIDLALRLFLAVLAGALIGWNRGEHGHPAGLRTTLLVCLAAAVAMIQANLLLDTREKPEDSFVVLDLMRLPLGILSGMGFIGAGAIIRRGELVQGVTTAATLWFVTVIGLCFGGGQLGLGIAATLLGYVVLELLKRLEDYLPAERLATVELTVAGDSTAADDLAAALARNGYRVVERARTHESNPPRRCYHYELHWRAAANAAGPADLLAGFAAGPDLVELSWRVGPPVPASG